jgi:hypothetical protein
MFSTRVSPVEFIGRQYRWHRRCTNSATAIWRVVPLPPPLFPTTCGCASPACDTVRFVVVELGLLVVLKVDVDTAGALG